MEAIVQGMTNLATDVQNPTLCLTCRPLFTGQRKDKKLGGVATEVLAQDIRQLEHAATHGCDLCRLRWSQLNPEERSDLRGCVKVTYGFWQSGVGDGIVFEYWLDTWQDGVKPRVSRSVKLMKLSELPAPVKQDLTAGESTSSSEALLTARQWVSDCDRDHAACQKWIRPDPTFLPTRLIKISADCSVEPCICDGSSLPQGTQYMVLSHCWGGQVPVQLKLANIDQFRKAILSDLPTTFSDAIHVTRTLGKQYLWIDSLCIIQDSTKDWDNEVVLMQRIYENAWCSIAATKAKNSSEGLFSAREPVSVRPVVVHTSWHSIQSEPYALWDLGILDSHIDETPLMRRGWVVQERILAPRILHFGQGQILWECCSLRACETFPRGLPGNTSFKPSMETKSLETEMIPFTTPELQAFRLWQAHVNFYTQCNLTMSHKDKLLAISGIARKIGPPDDYAAGLWRSVMVRQLRWTAAPGCTRPSTWRAPSWSWASIDGRVYADVPNEMDIEKNYRTLCNIVKVDVKLASADPFGPVLEESMIKLEAPLLRATMSITKNKAGRPLHWINNIPGRVTPDTGSVHAGATTYCLPLSVYVHPGSEAFYGITIEPASRKGEFHRCGTFHMTSMGESDGWLANAIQAFSETVVSDAVGPPVGGVEGHPWKRYAITLI